MNHDSAILAVLGPTNTGKTHFAVERMLGHHTGMIGFPLRLLAREVYDRVCARAGVASAALITGEEKIIPAHARYFLCTVESMPLDRDVEFLGVDEIQLCADPERGHIFTDRLLHARGRYETAFLGSDTMKPMIRALLRDVEFVSRPRFSKLTYSGAKKIGRLPRRTAVIGFSVNEVYSLAESIRRQRGGAAVVLGALSPRARNAQAQMFQSGEVDHLVATDAIGMGLNLDIDHVAFSGTAKFDGRRMRRLTHMEIAQIAGRAGRHMADGTFGVTDGIDGFDLETVEAVKDHRFPPLTRLFWRNATLDFSHLGGLKRSLDAPPPRMELMKGRQADDHKALIQLGDDPEIRARAKGRARVALLWEVCQLPDFQKTLTESHVRLIGEVYRRLCDAGRLRADWLAEQISRLDRVEGDIDTLMQRLAQVRTWTYVTHRSDWTDAAEGWRAKTRAIEDRLSDALHDRLTQRFVDRRASVLKRALKKGERLMSAIAQDGAVSVEGQAVGRLKGFAFVPDGEASAEERVALAQAARRALAETMPMIVAKFEAVDDAGLTLDDEGLLHWREGEDRTSVVARLTAGDSPLAPKLKLTDDDLLEPALRERVERRLESWLTGWMIARLSPLMSLKRALEAEDAELTANGRAVAYQTLEGFGSAPAEPMRAQIKALTQDERRVIARLGLRLGVDTVFIPDMLKPKPGMASALLWRLHAGEALAAPPEWLAGGRTSAVDDGASEGFVAAAGYRRLGPRLVRADMAERAAAICRRLAREGPFWPTAEMMSLTGAKKDEIGGILTALGYRRIAEGVPKPERPETAAETPKPEAPAQPVEAADTPAVEAPSAEALAALPAESVTPEPAIAEPNETEAVTPDTAAAEPTAEGAAEAPAEPAVELVDLYLPRRRDRAPRGPKRGEAAPADADGGEAKRAPRRRRGKPKPADATPRGDKPARPERTAAKTIDPDNPFAKLMELKFKK